MYLEGILTQKMRVNACAFCSVDAANSPKAWKYEPLIQANTSGIPPFLTPRHHPTFDQGTKFSVEWSLRHGHAWCGGCDSILIFDGACFQAAPERESTLSADVFFKSTG